MKLTHIFDSAGLCFAWFLPAFRAGGELTACFGCKRKSGMLLPERRNMRVFRQVIVAFILAVCLQPAAALQGSPAPDSIERKVVVVTEEQLVDIVSRLSLAAASELQRRGASTVFVDVAGMSGWDAQQLAWIAGELPHRVGAELEKSGFKLSKNCAAQNGPPQGTNTNAPLVKRFDLRPAPDLVVVLSVLLTSAPGTITICVQPPSEFLSSRRCEQRQSFELCSPTSHEHSTPLLSAP
jgi:hypothetical protein